MKVSFAAEARRDLKQIGDYIARDDPDRAVSFVRELRNIANGLAEWPERFPVVERYAATGMRRRVHGSYGIYYRLEPTRILVLRVVHGARDKALLRDR